MAPDFGLLASASSCSQIRTTCQPARRKAEPGNQETVTIREIAITIIVTSAAFNFKPSNRQKTPTPRNELTARNAEI
jgi:hypothetical protein